MSMSQVEDDAESDGASVEFELLGRTQAQPADEMYDVDSDSESDDLMPVRCFVWHRFTHPYV